jgi:hypothetical protein
MHPPGYIQEGQETIFGYLLLGVYHRNSPGCTTRMIKVGYPLEEVIKLTTTS